LFLYFLPFFSLNTHNSVLNLSQLFFSFLPQTFAFYLVLLIH
jgi:hypothetical protein